MNPTLFAEKLIALATNFVGLTETKSNAEWDDPLTKASEKEKSNLLSKTMKRVSGWAPGASYCVAADGACVALTLEQLGQPEAAKKFLKAWTAGVMNNVEEMKRRECLSKRPLRGSIWLAQHGKTWKGHAGIVTDFNDRSMSLVEFNTSAGSTADPELQRNGDGIFSRVRNLQTNGDLITRGWVSPAALILLSGLKLT